MRKHMTPQYPATTPTTQTTWDYGDQDPTTNLTLMSSIRATTWAPLVNGNLQSTSLVLFIHTTQVCKGKNWDWNSSTSSAQLRSEILLEDTRKLIMIGRNSHLWIKFSSMIPILLSGLLSFCAFYWMKKSLATMRLGKLSTAHLHIQITPFFQKL